MQRTRASVVVKAVSGVGLLLRLDDYRARPQRMHRAASHVNHLALIDVDPVEQFFGAILLDGLPELPHGDAGLQTERDLRSGLSVGDVPALSFAPRIAEPLRRGVVGVNLHREFFLGKQELHQQRKALRVARGRTHQVGAEFLAQVCQRSFRQRPVRDHAVVAGQPGFSDALVEFVIGVDRGKIECAPGARVEGGLHQEWIELGHGNNDWMLK